MIVIKKKGRIDVLKYIQCIYHTLDKIGRFKIKEERKVIKAKKNFPCLENAQTQAEKCLKKFRLGKKFRKCLNRNRFFSRWLPLMKL